MISAIRASRRTSVGSDISEGPYGHVPSSSLAIHNNASGFLRSSDNNLILPQSRSLPGSRRTSAASSLVTLSRKGQPQPQQPQQQQEQRLQLCPENELLNSSASSSPIFSNLTCPIVSPLSITTTTSYTNHLRSPTTSYLYPILPSPSYKSVNTSSKSSSRNNKHQHFLFPPVIETDFNSYDRFLGVHNRHEQ